VARNVRKTDAPAFEAGSTRHIGSNGFKTILPEPGLPSAPNAKPSPRRDGKNRNFRLGYPCLCIKKMIGIRLCRLGPSRNRNVVFGAGNVGFAEFRGSLFRQLARQELNSVFFRPCENRRNPRRICAAVGRLNGPLSACFAWIFSDSADPCPFFRHASASSRNSFPRFCR